jgi:thioredoxin reductase (NADPH)
LNVNREIGPPPRQRIKAADGQLTGVNCGADAPTPYNVFQTSLAGVFAVGDVRSGSVKRVASAVGEGSVVVQAVHARLASLREA